MSVRDIKGKRYKIDIYLFVYCEKKVMQYYNKCMNLWWVLNKFYFVCIVKTQVDKIMKSVKKGVKYMVIISSQTFFVDISHIWVI